MSNEELVAAIQSGEDRMGELWIHVEGLVRWAAKRKITVLEGHSSVEFEDLYQSGYLAMVSAASSYTPGDLAFSTWLMYYLRTAFSEAAGHRTKKQKRDPLNSALSLIHRLEMIGTVTRLRILPRILALLPLLKL